MNILIVGGGKAGSWEMRGLQLGRSMGARTSSDPTEADLLWADVIVLVKRAALSHGDKVKKAGKPIVWDALDFWSQPAQNHLGAAAATALLMQHVEHLRPTLVIGATEAMALSCGGVCLPHHGRIGLTPTDARPECRVVGYDGNGAYLERWAPALRDACRHRGWSFVVNQPDLSACDILVSFRGGIWDGWPCREWKSGVKIANAILAGRPILMQDSAAWRELRPAGSVVDTPDDLGYALDYWSDFARRQAVAEGSKVAASRFTVESMARRYTDILTHVLAAA